MSDRFCEASSLFPKPQMQERGMESTASEILKGSATEAN